MDSDKKVLELRAPDPAPAADDAELLLTAVEIGQVLELPDQLRCLIERSAGWSGADRVFALAPGEERKTWSPIASNAVQGDPALASLGSADPDVIRTALKDGTRVFEGLGPFEPGAAPWPAPRPSACAVLPVCDRDGAWAAVLLLVFDGTPEDRALTRIEHLLEIVRPSVSNALQVAAMRELVIKDDTAHCFNRRYFESCLPDELSRAQRFDSPLSLIFLDMDNLKEVNKRHGHAMGSRTLREVSGRVRVKIRRFDKLFRFGGDEFCIVLPETEWQGALEVAERVRDAIAGKPFLGAAVKPDGIAMTASLGIASFPLHARTQADLIECADRAMQRIKNGTKNSIGIAETAGGDHGR